MLIEDHLWDMAQEAAEGHKDPSEVYAVLYKINKTLADCLAMVKEAAVEEVAKYGKEGVVKNGLLLTSKAGAGRWNYKGVAAHVEQTQRLKEIEALAQAAYKTGAGIADKDGQYIEPAQYFAGADTIVCTKPKE